MHCMLSFINESRLYRVKFPEMANVQEITSDRTDFVYNFLEKDI